MRLLDSNIIIYASKPGYEFLYPIVSATDVCTSAISYIEVAGYHLLSPREAALLDEFFANTPMLAIEAPILDQAVALRRQKRMTLGDSVVAASALVHKCTLVTRNTSDFSGIAGLTLHDPFATHVTP